jgi:hypothetical protein
MTSTSIEGGFLSMVCGVSFCINIHTAAALLIAMMAIGKIIFESITANYTLIDSCGYTL